MLGAAQVTPNEAFTTAGQFSELSMPITETSCTGIRLSPIDRRDPLPNIIVHRLFTPTHHFPVERR